MAVLAIAFVTALVVERLYEIAHRQQDAAVSLIQLEEEANEQQIDEYEAIIEGEVTPEITSEISASRAEVGRSLDNLAELRYETENLARVRGLPSGAQAAMNDELILIEQGRIEETRVLGEEIVDRVTADA